MNVAFRVDASIEIGTGHVMRCLSLAQALRERGARCRFICRARPGDLVDIIRDRGFAIDVLSDVADQASTTQEEFKPAHASWLGVDWMSDARQTRAVLADVRLNWLVVDHYALDARWERAVRLNCDRLMVIDDLADRPHDCDLLLDQSFGHSAADYVRLLPRPCVVLVGPRYALLRHEFAATRDYSLQRRAKSRIKTILITMGGVDRDNATGRVLRALEERRLPTDIVVKVVIGPSAPWLHEVRAASAQTRWRTDVLFRVPDMAQVMADSDLAIGAAGGTSWERCCLGLPTVLLVLARNQEGVAKALSASGAAIYAGDIVSGPERAASEAVRIFADPEPLGLLSKTSAELCDGKGLRRVTREILAIAGVPIEEASTARALGADVTLRLVRLDDCAELWEWRNDLESRRNSVVNDEVPWSDHLRWFNASFANSERVIFIGELSGKKCGMVRFDRVQPRRNVWDVSIAINPPMRGRGVGGIALAKACAQMEARHGACVFAAKVRPRNIPSIRMFERRGFSVVSDANDFVHLRRSPTTGTEAAIIGSR